MNKIKWINDKIKQNEQKKAKGISAKISKS